MIKALAKYLLSLCVLLLSGYHLTAAQVSKESAPYHRLSVSSGANYFCQYQPQGDHIYISKSAPTGPRKQARQLDDSLIEYEKEEREDKSAASKKHSQNPQYFVATRFPFADGYFSSDVRKNLFSRTSSGSPSYRRHIVFRVFLI